MCHRVLVVAWMILLGAGCATLEAVSAGHIGCPETEIEVFNDQQSWGSRSWSARCRGQVYHCIGIGGQKGAPHVSCKGEPRAEAPATAPVMRAHMPVGCQYDTQCRGERICHEGRCVDPESRTAGSAPLSRAHTPVGEEKPLPVALAPSPRESVSSASSKNLFEERLGISLGDADKHAAAMGLKVQQGAVLLSVDPKGLAHRHNMRRGDVIVGLAFSRVKSLADAHRFAQPIKPGESFHIIVQRGDRHFSFKMSL